MQSFSQTFQRAIEVFLDRGIGKAEPRGDCLLREPFDPAHPQDFATALRKPIEYPRQLLQALPPTRLLLRRELIDQHARQLGIFDLLDCHDAIAADSVDQKIPGGDEEERLRNRRPDLLRGLEHANVDVVTQVLHISRSRTALRQVARQRTLVRQDLANKPGFEGVVHAGNLTARASVYKAISGQKFACRILAPDTS